MGGFTGTTFQVGLLQLGGTAAFFAGVMILLGDRIRDELNLYSSTEPYRSQIEVLQKERDDARSLARRLNQQRVAGNCQTAQCTIADVKKMRPDDPFVEGIRKLVEGEDPPFVSVLREIPVKVAVVGGLGDNPVFNICQDTLDKLNEGVEIPDPDVQFSRTQTDGSKAKINARRAGRIGIDVCTSTGRDFDVQINCGVALKLFADRVSSCSEVGALRGATVSIGSLAD
jgi:hypothetical protein